MNNIVGLKPSVGLISTAGVVPACRSLDCVSIFALTADDAFSALNVVAGPDPADGYSRNLPLGSLGDLPPALRIAIPRKDDLIFFGDARAQAMFELAVKRIERLGATIAELDLSLFFETARLLYEGPWVAERYAAVGDFLATHADDVHPITRKVIGAGKAASAVDAFRGQYRLQELRAHAAKAMQQLDALMVPTAPSAYTIAQIEADPIVFNSRLGTYTNFVNLLDLAAFSAPVTIAQDGTPFGVTFIAPAGQDAALASLSRAFHAASDLPLGALKKSPAPLKPLGTALNNGEIALAVVGAHLSGMPLNGELRQLGARFLETVRTASDYKLYELPGSKPPKPGLLRVARNAGVPIEVELWALRADAFGRFIDSVPAPLSIGTLVLSDGRSVKGFLVEALAVSDARDISQFGGWRGFVGEKVMTA
jgi:allophanate hydrolase